MQSNSFLFSLPLFSDAPTTPFTKYRSLSLVKSKIKAFVPLFTRLPHLTVQKKKRDLRGNGAARTTTKIPKQLCRCLQDSEVPSHHYSFLQHVYQLLLCSRFPAASPLAPFACMPLTPTSPPLLSAMTKPTPNLWILHLMWPNCRRTSVVSPPTVSKLLRLIICFYLS